MATISLMETSDTPKYFYALITLDILKKTSFKILVNDRDGFLDISSANVVFLHTKC